MAPLDVLRTIAFAVFVAGAGVALAAWAVRTRQVSPFSALGRALRSLSEPFVKPMENWLVKNGRNPQSAAWWIFGIPLIAGIVIIGLANWIAQQAFVVSRVGGGAGTVRVVLYYAGQVVLVALIVRVVGSWVGVFRYNRWMRPAYLLTDWMITPLQKIIPPVGMFDLSPLIAWFLLSWLLRRLL